MVHKSLLPLNEEKEIARGYNEFGYFDLLLKKDSRVLDGTIKISDTVNFGGILFDCTDIYNDGSVCFRNKYKLFEPRKNIIKKPPSDLLSMLFSKNSVYKITDIELPSLVDLKKFGDFVNIGYQYWLSTEVLGTPEHTYCVDKNFEWNSNGLHKPGTVTPQANTEIRGVRPVLCIENLKAPIGTLIDVFGYTWYVFSEKKCICDTIIGNSSYINESNIEGVLFSWLLSDDKVNFNGFTV